VTNDATLHNFIYKHIIDLKNVQRIRKKGEFTRCQVSSNYMSKSFDVTN